jgi:hypothetical protein
MTNQRKLEDFIHDLVYDLLVLMKDDSIFGETEYDKGYIDSLFEIYKMLQDKISLFELESLPIVKKMPLAEDWHREGAGIIKLD